MSNRGDACEGSRDPRSAGAARRYSISGPSRGHPGGVLGEQVDKVGAAAYWYHVVPSPFIAFHYPPSLVRCRHACPPFYADASTQLAAENLFFRKQLALYQERHVKPRRPNPATRVILVLLSRLLEWRSLLARRSTPARAVELLHRARQAGYTGPLDRPVASVASVRHTRAEPHWSDSDDPFQHLTPAERFARAIERRDS